ncbi:MAG: hypothetical protein M0R73_10170 [Dehalococcoidia bacterium]|nr:hypothetical protein [Dehalococcoidia bacterium]
MDLLHLVDRLEEMVAGAQKMPIGNRAILDRRRMLDLIDQMRIAIPNEVREAQDIVAQRDGIKREAEEEGRIIVARAEERAADLVEEHAITTAAKRRAEEIAVEAERRLEQQIDAANQDIAQRIQESRRIAREQMEAADEYARELLIRLERQLQAFQNSIHAGVQQLEPQPPPFPDRPAPLHDQDDPRYGAPQVRYSDDRPAPTPPYDEPTWVRESRGAGGSLFGDEGAGDQGARDQGELENLLQPRRPLAQMALDDDAAPEPANPGVIDDFENEPYDDDPMLRPARDRREDDLD